MSKTLHLNQLYIYKLEDSDLAVVEGKLTSVYHGTYSYYKAVALAESLYLGITVLDYTTGLPISPDDGDLYLYI